MTTTKAHFEAIGRVAYEWSRLELHVQLFIGALAGLPANESLIITNPANPTAWLPMVRLLAVEKIGWKALRADPETLRQGGKASCRFFRLPTQSTE
jgi:hypothetical protein